MGRIPRAARRWLPAAVAGAALGALGWFLAREASGRRDGAERPAADVEALRRSLRAAGAAEVEVRRLSPGIVELVGRVDDPLRADRFLDVAARAPGAEVVVNRLWRPAPARSRPPPPGPAPGPAPN